MIFKKECKLLNTLECLRRALVAGMADRFRNAKLRDIMFRSEHGNQEFSVLLVLFLKF